MRFIPSALPRSRGTVAFALAGRVDTCALAKSHHQPFRLRNAAAKIERPPNTRVMVSPFAVEKMFSTLQTNSYEGYLWLRLGLMANCNLLENLPRWTASTRSTCARNVPVRLTLVNPPNNKIFEPLADFASVAVITAPGKVLEWKRARTTCRWRPPGKSRSSPMTPLR